MNRLITKAARLSARWIPAKAYCVKADASGAVYCYPGAGARVVVLAYRGTAGRPSLHVTCRNIDSATETIASWLRGLEASATAKAARQAARKAWTNPLVVGDILNTCWGYDQTNVDFYVVTKVSGRRVWVRELVQDSEATAYMTGRCWPKMPLEMVGDESMHVAQPSGEKDVYLTVNGHTASRETGRAHHFSSYA